MGGLSPTIKIEAMNQFVILSFGVDPLNWPSFIEIGEIACSTAAWCTHGLTLNAFPSFLVEGSTDLFLPIIALSGNNNNNNEIFIACTSEG